MAPGERSPRSDAAATTAAATAAAAAAAAASAAAALGGALGELLPSFAPNFAACALVRRPRPLRSVALAALASPPRCC